MSSTTASRTKLGVKRRPADNARKVSKEIDTALPGKHTRELCDKLSWIESSTLGTMRTWTHERDGGTLTPPIHRMGSAATARRAELLKRPDTRRDSISFHLGGKTTSVSGDQQPSMKAVRATIRSTKAMGRLENT